MAHITHWGPQNYRLKESKRLRIPIKVWEHFRRQSLRGWGNLQDNSLTFLSNAGTGLKPSTARSWTASLSFPWEAAGPSFGLHPRSLSLVLSLPSFQASVEAYFHRFPWSLESQAPFQPEAYTMHCTPKGSFQPEAYTNALDSSHGDQQLLSELKAPWPALLQSRGFLWVYHSLHKVSIFSFPQMSMAWVCLSHVMFCCCCWVFISYTVYMR